MAAGSRIRAHLESGTGHQVVVFATIGVISTITSLVLFLVLRVPIGAVGANIVALTTTTVANAWANRRWTFGRRGRDHRWRQLGATVGIYVAVMVVSSLALSIVQGPLPMELLAIGITWSAATVTRFALLKSVVFRQRRRALEQTYAPPLTSRSTSRP